MQINRLLRTLFALLFFSTSVQGEELTILGDWYSEFLASWTKMTLVLHVDQDSAGLNATLDSWYHGTFEIPVDSITLQDQSLKIEMNNIAATFEGSLIKGGTEIAGKFIQNGVAYPVTFRRTVIQMLIP